MIMAKTPAKEKASRLVILDSHAIIHRAYHAIPDFSSSKGEPTGALYGLVSMLLKIIDDLSPDYIVATRDLPGPTHRHDLFEAYKGTRAKIEDELVVQLERAPRVFEGFGIPLYEAPGYEADDCIGTIVKKVSTRRDIETIIASGDMDMLQLVGDRVRVFTIRTGINDLVLFDSDRVHERYGFGPEFMTDFKGIRGDVSDNIPGVPGVGEGTASKLIEAFGGLNKIYAAIKKHGVEEVAKEVKVQKRYVQLVANNESQAAFSKQLATIHTDAPITFEVPKRQWHLDDHAAAIMELCDELEFRSLKERVRAAVGNTPAVPEDSSSSTTEIDPDALREASVALWLLRSDILNPSLDDILEFGNTDDFEIAREKIFKDLRETGKLQEVYDKIEHPLMPVIKGMNKTGVLIDLKRFKELSREYSKELGEIAGRIFKVAGHEFNINSPKQLATVLYDELKITPERHKKTSTGARTTREDELVKLAEENPVVGDILSYRELQKLLSTYIEKMPTLVGDDGRLHAEFLQAGAATGRMASQNPNLQNIPVKTEYGKRIRNAFIAEKGFVLAAIDYSQIELRIAAGLSGDKKLVDTFKRGGDIHTAVAAEVFSVPPEHVDYEMRRRAKVINFGILYGMGVNALRATLGTSVTRDEAAQYLDNYFKEFSGLERFIEHTKADARRRGYTETIFGRRRYFPGLKSPLPNMVAQAERMAINAPMQGTQSDIIKLAMVEADALIEKKKWREKARLLLQVHDELVYEVDEKQAEEISTALKHVMESVISPKDLHDVPIIAEIAIGKNWGEMKRIGT